MHRSPRTHLDTNPLLPSAYFTQTNQLSWATLSIPKSSPNPTAFVDTTLMLCSTLDTLEKCTRHSLVSARLDTFNQMNDTTSDSQSVKQQSLAHTYTLALLVGCCCYGLIRKSLPFSLCSNSANSSVTKLKSAHKIGTTVGAPNNSSTNFHYDRTHNCTCTRFIFEFLLLCCFCFLYVVFFWVFRFSLRA